MCIRDRAFDAREHTRRIPQEQYARLVVLQIVFGRDLLQPVGVVVFAPINDRAERVRPLGLDKFVRILGCLLYTSRCV